MSVVLPLDLTGRAASNKVTDEVKTLLPADKRVLVLEHGPFYTKGLVVNRNDAQETLMVPGVDYQAVQLFPELTLRTGLEVCSAIIILRSSSEVGDSFKITAQMVGGDYSASAQGLQAMLDAADIDNSSVEWGQIYGRPAQYPAAHHLQDIEDAYGFEYVVNELESIRQAVEQGDASSREELSAYISGRFTALQQELAQMGSWTVSGDLNWGSARDERSGLTIQWGRSGLLTVGSSQIMHYHRVFTSRFYTMPVMEGKSVPVEGDWDLYAPFHTVVIGDQQAAVLPVGVTMPDDRHACFLALGRVKSSSGNQSYVGYVAMGLTDAGLNTSAPTGGSGAVVAQSYFSPALFISPSTSNRNDTVETTSGSYYSSYFTPSVNGGSGAYTYQWSLSNAVGNVSLDTNGNNARLKLSYSGFATEGQTAGGSGTLTCKVTDTITGMTDTRSVTSALGVTYHIPYDPVGVTISPSPLYNTVTMTTPDGTVYSDWVTATAYGGGGGITGSWTLVSTNPGSHTTNAGIETNGNKARLWLNYSSLTTDGAQTNAAAVLKYTANDSVSGFSGQGTVNIVLTAQRSVVYPTLVMSVTPGGTSKDQTVTTSSGMLYSEWFTQAASGGSGNYNTVVWALENAVGGVTIETQVVGGQPQARMVFAFNGLTTDGAIATGSGRLRATVTDSVTGLSASAYGDYSFKATRQIVYDDLSITMNPASLSTDLVVDTASGTIYGNITSATVTGGSGGYTYSWQIQGSASGAITADSTISGSSNQLRPKMAYSGLSSNGAFKVETATAVITVIDSVANKTKTASVPITMKATRQITYSDLSITLAPTSVTGDRTVSSAAGDVYSDWVAATVTGGSGAYTYAWTVEGGTGGVVVDGSGTSARLKLSYSGLNTNGASASGSGTLRCTVTDSTANKSGSKTATATVKATRSITYPALTASLTPATVTNSRTVSGPSGTVYSDNLTGAGGGGSGNYSYAWSLVGPSGSVTIDGGGTTARLALAYSGLVANGAAANGAATVRLTVTDTVTGYTATADSAVSVSASYVVVYPPLGISMTGGNVSNDVTVDSASGTVYSDWRSSSGTGGSGSYAGSISVLSSSAGVSLDGGGVNGHIRFDYSGLVNNGSSATGTATLRYTITDIVTGQSVYADRTFSIKATRLTNYTQLGVSLTPTSSTATADAATSASSAYGNFVTPVISGGSGSYSVQWSISGNGTLSLSGNTARAAVNYDPNNLAVGANNFSGTLTCTVTDAMAGMQANASVPFSITINKAPPNSGTLTTDSLSWNGMASGGNGGSGFTLQFKADGTFYYEGRVGARISSSKSGTWMTGGSSGDFEIYFTNISYQSISSGGADGDVINSEADINVTPDTWLPLPQTVSIGSGGYSSMTSYDGDFDATIRDKNNHSNSVSFSISFHGTENCFAVGTLVRTEAGDLPIQTLAINTELESFTCDNMLDEDDPDWESWTSENPNIQQTSTFVRNIGVFKAQGGFVVNEFICTGGHVWFILRDGIYRWCRTRDLLPTDQLVSDDGPVDITTYFETAAEIQFVSMNVEDVDTYKVVDTHGRAYYTHNAFS